MITIKTKEEIETLREGGKRLATILATVATDAVVGASAVDLNAKAEKMIRDGGDIPSFLNFKSKGQKTGYPVTLCVSVNDEVVHGITKIGNQPKIFKDGDVVGLDLGLIHKGLYTDHAVTVTVGKVSAKVEKLLKVTKDSMYAGIDAAVVGAHTGDVGLVIQKFAEQNGLGIIRDLAGHGVGYAVHEDPFVPNYGAKGEGPVLKEGMVLAIEPMFTLGGEELEVGEDGFAYRTKDHSLGAHFEHTIVITDKGADILTRL